MKSWRISGLGTMEINTMRAIVADNVHSLHIYLSSWVMNLNHLSSLPWVFTCCGENNVVTLDVKTSIVLVYPSWIWNNLFISEVHKAFFQEIVIV